MKLIRCFTETSPTIRKHLEMHPKAATSHAKILRGLINKKCDAIQQLNKAETMDFTKELDQAVLEYIPEIKRLSEMPGGLELACELIIFLSSQSYSLRFRRRYNRRYSKAQADFYVDSRPADALADDLLEDILETLKEKNPNFDFAQNYARIEPNVKFFDGQNMPYLQKSFGLLSSWLEAPGFAVRMFDRLRKEIAASNKKAEVHEHLSSRRLIARSVAFLPEVRRLANLPDGDILAFDLLMFLGRQSYVETGVIQFNGVNRLKDVDVHKRAEFEGLLDEMLQGIASHISAWDVLPDAEGKYDWDHEKALECLQGEVEYFIAHGLKTYLPQTFDLLAGWSPSLAEKWVEGIRDDIKTDMLKERNRIVKRYSRCVDDLNTPNGDWLGTAMKQFDGRIQILSLQPKGCSLAIDLIVFLVEISYTDVFKLYTSDIEESGLLPRSFDKRADKWLIELMELEESGDFDAKEIHVNILRSRGTLVEHDTSNYFARSLEYLQEIISSKEPVPS
jgi:hypothetical protein